MTVSDDFRARLNALCDNLNTFIQYPTRKRVEELLVFIADERKQVKRIPKLLVAEVPEGISDKELAELLKKAELAQTKIDRTYKSFQLFLDVILQLLDKNVSIDINLQAMRASVPKAHERERFIDARISYLDDAEAVIRRAITRRANANA